MFQGESLVPKRMFFTKGVGIHREKLTSFEMALRDAGIAQFNLVRISGRACVTAESFANESSRP